MTSIEWLFEEYKLVGMLTKAMVNKAQQMHKQEIIDAANQNEFEDIDGMGICDTITKGEQYYQETFISKGSDESKTNKI